VSEPDIIKTLRDRGYSVSEIDKAMKEALKTRVSGGAGAPEPATLPPPPPREFAQTSEDLALPAPIGPPKFPKEEFPETPTGKDFIGPPSPEPVPLEPELPEEPSPPPIRTKRGGIERRDIEELTEVIVEEKLRDVNNRFREMQTQLQQTNNKIETLSQEINRIKSEKTGELKGIESKIDSYKQNMTELNGRIESMERALKESLSPMLESLRSLSETIKMLKKKG
jgi:DNA-binding transcriptional MerR regulator